MKTIQLLLAAMLSVSGCAHAMAADTKILDDRGSKLEVIMHLQATPSASGTPKIAALARTANLTGGTLGVVFNHALQAKGVVNGEITFAIKGMTPGSYPEALYPGFRKLVNPNVYIVTARSIDEFVLVFERLKARPDVEWVEPNVQYVGGASSVQDVIDAAK